MHLLLLFPHSLSRFPPSARQVAGPTNDGNTTEFVYQGPMARTLRPSPEPILTPLDAAQAAQRWKRVAAPDFSPEGAPSARLAAPRLQGLLLLLPP